jgi:hypothetical protein
MKSTGVFGVSWMLSTGIAILKMAFHGFGGGSARMSELEEAEPTMLHCLFCNHTIY